MAGANGGLKLENVKFVEIRCQYKTLIFMSNSANLSVLNTHFEKVQTSPLNSQGHVGAIVKIEYDDSLDCPDCTTIIFQNCSIKFMNYGHNYTSTL